MLSTCTEPSCKTIVFGSGPCLEHEQRPTRTFVRGRPFIRPWIEGGVDAVQLAADARTRLSDGASAIALTRS
jgi:hypothetical protein